MKAFTLLIIFLALHASSNAQYLRHQFTQSQVVVVGEVSRSSDGEDGFKWRRDRPQDPHEAVRVCVVRLRILNTIKGQVASEIDIALPKGYTYDDPMPTNSAQRYDIRNGQKAIWFLQESASGEFHIEHFPEDPYMWTAPGHQYSVTEWNGQIGGNIPILETRCQTTLRPMLQIADLLASNAWVTTDAEKKSAYVGHLEDMTPLEQRTLGYGVDLAGDEFAAYNAWLDTRLPLLYPAILPKDRIVSAAIKMSWGRGSAETDFVNLFLALPENSLVGRFPPLYTMEAGIRVLPKMPIDTARLMFRELKQGTSYKVEITRVGIRRFGEHHYLDAAILECLAALWDRPDLSPIVGGMVQQDLSEKIERARQLLG